MIMIMIKVMIIMVAMRMMLKKKLCMIVMTIMIRKISIVTKQTNKPQISSENRRPRGASSEPRLRLPMTQTAGEEFRLYLASGRQTVPDKVSGTLFV